MFCDYDDNDDNDDDDYHVVLLYILALLLLYCRHSKGKCTDFYMHHKRCSLSLDKILFIYLKKSQNFQR